jgi:hypothetical protein
MKNNENWGTKETMHFLSLSNEALRIENARLLDEVERLTNNIEVHDAEILDYNMDNQNKYITYLNYTLKN